MFAVVAACLLHPVLPAARGALSKKQAAVVFATGLVLWIAVVLIFGWIWGVNSWVFFAIPGLLAASVGVVLLSPHPKTEQVFDS